MFEPWELGLIDEYGYNGLGDEHIDRVADTIEDSGLTSIDEESFECLCRMSSVTPGNFTEDDLYELQRRLNED